MSLSLLFREKKISKFRNVGKKMLLFDQLSSATVLHPENICIIEIYTEKSKPESKIRTLNLSEAYFRNTAL